MDEPTVYIVDDDESVRNALTRLLSAHGTRVKTFSSGRGFLDSGPLDSPACIVMDVRMPNATGVEVLDELARRGIKTPVIFLTGYATVPTSVRAMKLGAMDFLSKPVDENDLMSAVFSALDRDRDAGAERARAREIQERYACLTRRERQVLYYVAHGTLNKQIAHTLGITEKTVKVHRSHIMAKMQVGSVAQLVRMVDVLERAGADRQVAGSGPTES